MTNRCSGLGGGRELGGNGGGGGGKKREGVVDGIRSGEEETGGREVGEGGREVRRERGWGGYE